MFLPEIYISSDRKEWETLLEEAVKSRCRYYASDIIRRMEIDELSFSEALFKAERAMEIMDIPIEFHVRRVYRSYDTGIGTDLKLSPLAAYLISVTTHHPVADEDIIHMFAARFGLALD